MLTHPSLQPSSVVAFSSSSSDSDMVIDEPQFSQSSTYTDNVTNLDHSDNTWKTAKPIKYKHTNSLWHGLHNYHYLYLLTRQQHAASSGTMRFPSFALSVSVIRTNLSHVQQSTTTLIAVPIVAVTYPYTMPSHKNTMYVFPSITSASNIPSVRIVLRLYVV